VKRWGKVNRAMCGDFLPIILSSSVQMLLCKMRALRCCGRSERLECGFDENKLPCYSSQALGHMCQRSVYGSVGVGGVDKKLVQSTRRLRNIP
jgi:hypothetical protein